jgi:geranylgeranyl diphosphate synthase type I
MMESGTAREALAWSRRRLDPALRAAVDSLPGSMRRVASYHFGWSDEHGAPAEAAGGKAIRPALVLLTAQAVTGGPAAADASGPDAAASDASVAAAVAVELVHNFTLLHDDVMDGDATRRNRPTAWSVFGTDTAILTGDALLTLAFDTLAASEHPAARGGLRMLGAAVQALLDGQHADIAFEKRPDVDLAECQRMAESKTGALLGCAGALGALFGDAEPERIRRLRGFGADLGLGFQHVDDMLGIWGDPAVTGKPVYSDLRNRKKSLPVVAALTSRTPAGRELDALYRRDRPLSDSDLEHAARLVEIAGGRAWSRAEAARLCAQALRQLWSAVPRSRPAADLASLARLITCRDH